MTHIAQAATNTPPDYTQLKAKQQITWGSGDYGRIGITVQIVGEELCEAMDVRAGSSVLDVAGGNGNASIAAARRFCKVICTDYVDELLDEASARATAEGVAIDCQFADAEELPFADGTFDNVVSTFGVMFAPNQQRASAELLRVCKAGGKIGMANWTPSGFIGQLLKVVSQHVSPPAGVAPPVAWGTEQFIKENFAASAHDVQTHERSFVFRYQSPQHWLDVFSAYYGPMFKAFEQLSADGADSLNRDILDLIASLNRADDGTMVVPSSYLEVIVNK